MTNLLPTALRSGIMEDIEEHIEVDPPNGLCGVADAAEAILRRLEATTLLEHLHHLRQLGKSGDWEGALRLLRSKIIPLDGGGSPDGLRHTYKPHPKYPLFCADCGYPEHERLQHAPRERDETRAVRPTPEWWL